jgi:hypothetical protein
VKNRQIKGMWCGAAPVRTAVIIATLALLPRTVLAQAPAWWAERGVIATDPATSKPRPANDYAAANQGQVKFIAVVAIDAMNAKIPGGAGDALNKLRSQLVATAENTNDYAVVNIGQLKTVAKPFYDRLIALHYASKYPWEDAPAASNDYAVANIGQVKNLFSFELVPK